MSSNLISAPYWVPKEKRVFYDYVLEQAKDYSDILKSDPEIVDARQEGKYIYFIVKRGKIWTEIKVGKFDKLNGYKMDGDTLEIEYKNIEKPNNLRRLQDLGTGFVSGGLLFLLIALFLL